MEAEVDGNAAANADVPTGQGRRSTEGCERLHFGSGPATFGPFAHGVIEVRQGQIALVRWPREPFRRYAANPLAAAHVHLVATGAVPSGVQNFQLGHGSSP